MADKYVNAVGVQTIKTWIEGKFATEAALETLDDKVDQIIAEGGEPNVIEVVKVNGTALTPDANKAVDVPVPEVAKSGSGEEEKVTVTSGQNSYDMPTVDAMEAYVSEHGGVIQKVKVAGTELPIDSSDKSVNIPAATTSADGAMSAADKTKLDGVEAGAEENTIESISIGGTAQTIDQNKNVELDLSSVDKVFVATQNVTTYAELLAAYNARKCVLFRLSNSSKKNQAASVEAGTNIINLYVVASATSMLKWSVDANNVWTNERSVTLVSRDDIAQTYDAASTNAQSGVAVASGIAAALANSGDAYQTESDVDSKIATAVSSAYKYKGSVATVADLPASGNETGDVWDVQATGVNYAWTGTAWDALGSYVDTSVLWTSVTGQTNTLEAMTVAEINAILNPTTP